VGKIGVSDSILLKPAKLTADEWTVMRLHPEIGYNMLRQVKFLQGAAELILAHHERWDGQGYPNRLREEDIPLGSRIFMVVDTFDSMTSDRPYRKGAFDEGDPRRDSPLQRQPVRPAGRRSVPRHLRRVGEGAGGAAQTDAAERRVMPAGKRKTPR